MIICNSKRYIFIHLHKTGGSSFEIAAEPTLRWNDLLLGSTEMGELLNRYYMQKHGLNKHSSLADVLKICNGSSIADYRILTIVRHPIKRAISLYRFVETMIGGFCESQNISLAQVHAEYEQLKSAYWPLCWPASEAYIMTHGDLNSFFFHSAIERETAAKSQWSQLSVDGNLPPRLQVIKLEELDQSEQIIMDYVGATLNIPHENKSKTRTVGVDDLSTKTLDHLSTRYKIDMASFGYE